MFYAGIGARGTPRHILELMSYIAKVLAENGWELRTGGADGADQAFMRGANEVDPNNVHLYVPYLGYKEEFRHPSNHVTAEAEPWAYELAAVHHPAWDRCSSFARRAHARNNHILMGLAGDHVEFVLCWTPNAEIVGGTGQAMRVAFSQGIPVYNLADPAMRAQIEERIEQLAG